MNNNDKLFLVELNTLTSKYKDNYVVAKDPTEAYNKVFKFLNDKDYGLSSHRELKRVTLIAEACEYNDIGITLFI